MEQGWLPAFKTKGPKHTRGRHWPVFCSCCCCCCCCFYIGQKKCLKFRRTPSFFKHEETNERTEVETVTSFKCLGSVITDEGSKPEIFSRIAQTTATLTRLKPVWNDRSISLSFKIRPMRSLVTSIFLYACESWTLTAELQRRIQAMEMRFNRKIPHISYKDHATNEEVRAKIQQATGLYEDLLTIVKRRKLQWHGHVSRSSGLAKTTLQGTVKGGRVHGRQRKRWEDNIREWTGLEFGKSQRGVENREKWRKLVATSSVVPQR